ncbi:hypothetical protein EYC80_004023 [Monilinia laxa]|uniref:Uncharacterized protein n=1 Tax=Monilinia laxa TaxID=61186 RepID=A0A5N6KLG8_MONLA|nr:hypothetical protein EYC80_004023 [Monilinia laxa]
MTGILTIDRQHTSPSSFARIRNASLIPIPTQQHLPFHCLPFLLLPVQRRQIDRYLVSTLPFTPFPKYFIFQFI